MDKAAELSRMAGYYSEGHEYRDRWQEERQGGRWNFPEVDSDESQRTRFDYVVASWFERNPAPSDYIIGANRKLSTSW